MGEKKTLLSHSRMLHDPKTVIVSDFDQEAAEKIAPQFIPRLELANCMHLTDEITNRTDAVSSQKQLLQKQKKSV